MKFIQKKVIKGREYYYFVFACKIGRYRKTFTRYLGPQLPADLKNIFEDFGRKIATYLTSAAEEETKLYFAPKNRDPIEEARIWYQFLHHELFVNDLRLFRSLFAILFILNSNRAEGSKVTRKDIEKIIARQQKPKTLLDIEILNSLDAVRFAFSKEMRWTIKSIQKIHRILLHGIADQIAGQFKKTEVIVNNETTTFYKKVRGEVQSLLAWLKNNKKNIYPPLLALEFHYRFEAIHPFEDGNGRVGRLLFNALLLQHGYMPTIFFSQNHSAYTSGISQARRGRTKKLAHYFIEQVKKTRKAIAEYKKEGIIRGGSPRVGQWEIEQGKIRRY